METLSVFDKFSEIFNLKKINQHVKLLEKGYKWHSAAYNASPYVNKLKILGLHFSYNKKLKK